MSFLEQRFPDYVSPGAQSSLDRPVDVITLRSGFERRNAVRNHSLRRYDVSIGIHDIDQLYDVIDFWEAVEGALYGFRFKDWSDFKSCKPLETISSSDQPMAQVSSSVYQLQKVYGTGGQTTTRSITKPVSGTVVVSANGSNLVEGSDFVVDTSTGLVYFGFEPISPVAGFEFDVPCRFQVDPVSINLELFSAGQLDPIMVHELKQEQAEALTGQEETALWNWLQAVDINTSVNTHWDSTWGTL